MQAKFEHFYQERYLILSWPEDTVMNSEAQVMELRNQWTASLSGWHSPYKALIDASNLRLDVADEHKDAFRQSFERTLKLLQGFFLQKAAVFGLDQRHADLMPFPLFASEDEARDALNINRQRKEKIPQSFREAIQFQNHFRQHVMEVSFSQDVVIDDKEKLSVLKSKITNNLMQWHSAWNLLIDCQNLEVAESLEADFQQMFRFFQGFFLKKVIGYSPKKRGTYYPFEVVLARHRAAAQLEAEGLFSGDDANCKSRRT